MKNKNWFWGIFFLLGGALIIVHQFVGFYPGVTLLNLVFSIFLVAILVQSLFHLNFFGVLMPVALLCTIFAKPLGLEAITPWPVIIAAVLGSIGLHVLFGSYFKRTKISHGAKHIGTGDKMYTNGKFAVNEESVSGSYVESHVRFGGGVKYLHSESLETVILSCKFGGMEVYFDQAKMSPKGAEVCFDCVCGGIELYIPSSWRVVSDASVSLGAVENGMNNLNSAGPTLTLTGKVSLGAVSVNYVNI